jgi:DNA ligase-1
MKRLKNEFTQNYLSQSHFNGLDGELIIGEPSDPDAFANTRGQITRIKGEPDFKFYVFDHVGDGPYSERWFGGIVANDPRIVLLEQVVLNSPEDVILHTNYCIELGYEGAMLRTRSGLYKQGRATFNEMNIFKRKAIEDAEGKIVGFTEQMTNTNQAKVNEMGLTSRSTSKLGKVPAGTLGGLILESAEWGTFKCGPGKLTHKKRQEIWNNKAKYLGRKVTYTFQRHGSIDAPRQPRYKRFYTTI